ncbi:low-density lipoprotein receptor-related protein 2-like [Planococcus citri]|uniref:low-density lipoprotein receptor-related protein 2-like n=1 Tax=Planococcus citri TaxID=170843 RepID=UPI0031F75191
MKMVGLNFRNSLTILYISIQLSYTQLPSKTFCCDSGEYIESDQYCDGYPQCPDGSDEPSTCNSTRRVCGTGKHLCPTSNSCIDADITSDVFMAKYCPPEGNNETNDPLVGFMSTLEDIFTRNSTRSEGKFICSVQKCLSIHFLCEEYCQCADCSDDEVNIELAENVNAPVESTNCEYEDNFRCDDNKRCLNLEYVCDGYCNCFDCSDEYGNCSKVDHQKIFDCPHFYFPTARGARCLGPRFIQFSYLENCTNEHICDQKCTQYKNRAICSCFDGYIKIPTGGNGFRCRSNVSSQNLLVYSTTTQIKLLNLTTGKDTIMQKSTECATLTAAHDYIYYTTYSNSNTSIFKHSSSTKKTTEIKLNILLDSPINSIAIDYITDNFYFTTNTSLFVCSNDIRNRICMQMKCCNVNYVALAPSYGWMFYTKESSRQGEWLVMRSNMDGSDEDALIDGSFRFPTVLAIDESIRRVYWLDSETDNRKLLSASFYGGDNEIRTSEYLGIVVSIAALDSRIFFTKARDNQIYILENKENFTKSVDENSKITRYHSNFDSSGLRSPSSNSGERLFEGNLTFSVQQLHAYNPIQQGNHKNPCLELETPCTGLCLLRSMNSTTGLGYSCLCRSSNSTTNPYSCYRSTSSIPETSSEGSTASSLINSGFLTSSSDQSLDQINATEPEHWNVIHPGLLVFCAIILGALVLSGYLLCKKRKPSSLELAQRRYHFTERVNSHDYDNFPVTHM